MTIPADTPASKAELQRELDAVQEQVKNMDAALDKHRKCIHEMQAQHYADLSTIRAQLDAVVVASSEAVNALQQRIKELKDDKAYLTQRLDEIIPLFEEARDALPAISLTSAKQNHVDLSLADRMDVAGTRTREEFDAAREKP